jgi:hypothetical protein
MIILPRTMCIMASYSSTNDTKDEKKSFFEDHGQYYLRWATYFVQMKDAIGICGLLNIQNCIGALKMLLYGMFVHVIDEYFKIDQNITILEAMKHLSSLLQVLGLVLSHIT